MSCMRLRIRRNTCSKLNTNCLYPAINVSIQCCNLKIEENLYKLKLFLLNTLFVFPYVPSFKSHLMESKQQYYSNIADYELCHFNVRIDSVVLSILVQDHIQFVKIHYYSNL